MEKTLDHKQLNPIRCLAVDVDGVLTDGQVFYGGQGEWIRKYFIRDGIGLMTLKEQGFRTAFITRSRAEDIRLRAERLQVDFIAEGVKDKTEAFSQLLSKFDLKAEQVLYVGDDIIDLPIFEICGFSVAPSDAHESVAKRADWISSKPGGFGAVREVCDLLLEWGGKP